MSGGRFVLGVGAGWSATEFAALGADHARRGPTTDEYLEIITEAWAKERVDGPAYQGVQTGPRPPEGRVPVWVGGASRRAVRRAVRSGSGWHPINPDLDWLRDRGLPELRKEAADQGRAVPELVVRMKARLQAHPADPGRPAGVGSLDQVVGDVAALAGLGAAEVILDPNPDQPRPRDHAAEQRQLREIKDAYAALA
jgi:alkanesulfonate monooxygenase SsuD/methylene tetrahydromethanopterin reductase-like flavin-dependent oxidoreductase (luciferase family)